MNRLKEFYLFILHKYSVVNFDARNVKENVKMLLQLHGGEKLMSERNGALKCVSPFQYYLRNILTLGAERSRLMAVVYYTFLTQALELSNPLNATSLIVFAERKLAFLRLLFKHIKGIGVLKKNQDYHKVINDYLRSSLLQHHIIKQMMKAARHQKKTEVIEDAKQALRNGLVPILTTRGLCGAYWMRGTDREVAGIFKPFDEETFGPNNPLGYAYRGAIGRKKTRRGIRVGEGPHREVAAYLVDEFFGLGIVPKTVYAAFSHFQFYQTGESALRRAYKLKYGSFQEYIQGFLSFAELTKEIFEMIPLDEFQLLILLDVIIGNTDRNTGNFLVGDSKLAALDHGLSFSETHADFITTWYWASSVHGMLPIIPSIVELLKKFPLEKLSWKLKKRCFIELPALHRMRERIALFRAGLLANLVPKQLMLLMGPHNLSILYELSDTLDAQAEKIVEHFQP